MSTDFLTAKQAASKLGVSVSTLYAYVSRGLIRSEPDKVKRRRRYRAQDVEALLARKMDRGGSERALAGALHWGEPLCESELTLIQDGQFYYRGQNVCQLATESTLEEVIDVLWGGYQRVGPPRLKVRLPWSDMDPVASLRACLPWLEKEDRTAYDLRPAAVRRTGARILRGLFRQAGSREEGGLVESLAESWNAEASLLRAAVILCADHELNVSAFTARCVASAGANPYQVVSAGLAALSGFRHGGQSYCVEALWKEAEGASPAEAVRSRLRRGENLPGFGHRLYEEEGDPRARCLLSLFAPPEPAAGLIQEVEDVLGERPNIDFALAALCRHQQLPSGAPILLFSLARTVGWIAHAIEQYQSERLIRPRARYTGPLPLQALQ